MISMLLVKYIFCVVPLDRQLLKDLYLLPWSDTAEFDDIMGITDPGISSLESHDETFHDATTSTDDPSVNLLHSPEVSSNDMLGGGYVSNNATTHQISNVLPASGIKQERQESELMKLLTRSKGSSEAKPVVSHPPAIKPLVQEQRPTFVPQPTTQTIPIQPVFSTAAQKLVFSPQPTQTLQICSIYQRPNEENQNPQALLTISG